MQDWVEGKLTKENSKEEKLRRKILQGETERGGGRGGEGVTQWLAGRVEGSEDREEGV